MSGRRAIWLVARREIVERMRERSLAISTGVTLAILVAIIVLPKALGLDGSTTYDVAASGPRAERVVSAAQQVAERLDVEVEVRREPSAAAVRDAVDDEQADAGLAGGAGSVVVRSEIQDELALVLQEGARIARSDRAPPPALPVSELRPGENSDQQQTIAFVAVIVLYAQLIGYGFWLAAGIVEEKTSRMVEVLLSTLRARDLLAGKILGIGAVGLAQLVLVGVVSAALAVAVDAVDVAGDAFGALGIVLAWFLLGYGFYACLFAAAAALVPRQEEIQNVTGPLTIVLVGSFILSFQAIDDPGGGLATVLSFVPPTAPMVSPVRVIAGDISVLEGIASALVLVASIAVLVVVAARIYAHAVMRTGTRVSLADAWRSAQV